jgi:hypothetical protein
VNTSTLDTSFDTPPYSPRASVNFGLRAQADVVELGLNNCHTVFGVLCGMGIPPDVLMLALVSILLSLQRPLLRVAG